MKILLDTNVVLDVLLAREPFVDDAREIFILIENNELEAYLCASSVTTIHYLMQKTTNRSKADRLIATLLNLFEVAPVTKDVLLNASTNNGTDYEDSVIYTAAKKVDVDTIITRDCTGFKNSSISVLKPREFLAFWKSSFSV
jgi:predicted nucleic acid-binding protein